MSFLSEVAEFHEPGGMMDHYASALGSLVHIDFAEGAKATPIRAEIPGCFVLFDTLQAKDTTRVLAESKVPVLEAVEQLRPFGIHTVRDYITCDRQEECLAALDAFHRRKLCTAVDNYEILQQAKRLLSGEGPVDEVQLGALLRRHHANLRDGLGISTDIMEKIFSVAYGNGALGGKLNGSGGGGCLYVYARQVDAPRILAAVEEMGYPGRILKMDTGARLDKVF